MRGFLVHWTQQFKGVLAICGWWLRWRRGHLVCFLLGHRMRRVQDDTLTKLVAAGEGCGEGRVDVCTRCAHAVVVSSPPGNPQLLEPPQ